MTITLRDPGDPTPCSRDRPGQESQVFQRLRRCTYRNAGGSVTVYQLNLGLGIFFSVLYFGFILAYVRMSHFASLSMPN